MNRQVGENQNIPLLFDDYDSNISEINMSSLYFINYYKEPYYHERAGIITEMCIPTFAHSKQCFVGWNYDEQENSEEDAEYLANKMSFSQCDFNFVRSDEGILSVGYCTANRGEFRHKDDLSVLSYVNCDTFDAWIKGIQSSRKNSFRFGFKIEFNQHARDVFLGQLIMNHRRELYEDEYLDFNLNNIQIQFSKYENLSGFQLSHPPA